MKSLDGLPGAIFVPFAHGIRCREGYPRTGCRRNAENRDSYLVWGMLAAEESLKLNEWYQISAKRKCFLPKGRRVFAGMVAAMRKPELRANVTVENIVWRTTLGQIIKFPPRRTKLDPKTHYISVYVKHMADELAELAEYAGCRRLANLFALASIEAETNPPVSPLMRDRLHGQENDQTPERALVRLKTSKAGQAISSMDTVVNSKKGAKEDNGAVTGPDKTRRRV